MYIDDGKHWMNYTIRPVRERYTAKELTELRADLRSSLNDIFRHFVRMTLNKARRTTLDPLKAADEVCAEVAKLVDDRLETMDIYVDEYMKENGVLARHADNVGVGLTGDLKMLLDHLMQVMPDGSRIATERMTGDDWRTLRDWLAELKETDHERWAEYHEECERADVELVEEIRDMEFRRWRDCPLFFRWTDDVENPSDESDGGE